jgi:hypothetical protein
MKKAFEIDSSKLEKMIQPIDKLPEEINKDWINLSFNITSFTSNDCYVSSLNSCTCPYYLTNSKVCKHQFVIIRYFIIVKKHRIIFDDNPIILFLNAIKHYTLKQIHSKVSQTGFSAKLSKTKKARKFETNVFTKLRKNLWTSNTHHEYECIQGVLLVNEIVFLKIKWIHYTNPTFDVFNKTYNDGVIKVTYLI